VDLVALADFNAVARHGGFGRAARATGRPKATLSRHVADLEKSLNVRLFERGTRTPKLTEEGRALHEKSVILLHELDEIGLSLGSGGDHPRGRLRISAPLLFAEAVMGKLAADFALAHPEVRLEVTAEDRAVDMVEEGYDLVVRVNPRPEADLVGRCFVRDRYIVVASSTVQRPQRDETVPAVLLARDNPTAPWAIKEGAARQTITPDAILRLSSLVMVRDAARTGIGAALLPLSMAIGDLGRGTLVSWGDADGRDVELWTLYTSRRLLSRKVSAFLSHLTQAFPNGTAGDLALFMN
jgi:DNA-binding transcriptional LysR family regulator